MRRPGRKGFWLIGVATIGVAIWALNTSTFMLDIRADDTRLIAHRGIHHTYAGTDRSATACHAAPVEPIAHAFVENTIVSMKEAFRLGADVVELDVHRTTDNRFAVFHDWTVDCRTNGAGITHKHSLAALQRLDLGYRIDDGTGTFPLRGRGEAQMPSLRQVLDAEMPGQFLINFKSNRAADGQHLSERFGGRKDRLQLYGVYGGVLPTERAVAGLGDMRGFSKSSVTRCLLQYIAVGWSGYVPNTCRSTMVMVPQNYTWLVWGWPHRFTRRMQHVGTDVILVGPYDGSGFSSGVDDAEAFAKVPEGFAGYVWTNRIELIGVLNARRKARSDIP